MPGGLTTRGRCLLAAGLAAAVCALVLDERDLLRIAAFVAALPLLATLTAGRARLGLDADRQLVPPRTPVGATSDVVLTLRSQGRLGASGLLLSDGVPVTLGSCPRFAVARVSRQSPVLLRYPLLPTQRGVYRVGPLVVRVTEPFGLAEFSRELAAYSRLVVTPVVVPLTGMPTGGELGSGERGAGLLHAGHGEDDAVVRSYRRGDDLRKVHWRSTARCDELMIRVEERPWRGGLCVLLDSRAGAHRGGGPGASFEYGVSLAASVCLHLQRHGQRVQLVTAGGQQLVGSREIVRSAETLLDALAALVPVHRSDLVHGPLTTGQDVVAVLGATARGTLEQLVESRPHGSGSSAVLLDVDAWDPGAEPRAGSADPSESARLLAAAGWSVTVAGPDQQLQTVWDQLCVRSALQHRLAR
ncbi:MAG: DUF58 domain-containing protein [Actinomycetota bacterium]|nr:DUF58 domain-containing protein [Actinomycetota bacterium]